MYTIKDLIEELAKQHSYWTRAFSLYAKSEIGSWQRDQAFDLSLHFDGRCRMLKRLINNILKSVSATA